MEQLTLKELKKCVDTMVKRGYGDRKLVVSDDNEGNGYHGMFYGVSPMEEDVEDLVNDSCEMDWKKLLIIG